MRESRTGVCAASNHGNADDSSPFCFDMLRALLDTPMRGMRHYLHDATTESIRSGACSRRWSSTRAAHLGVP